MFSILPFEVSFYERKHQYPIHYVGNPTVEEVQHFKNGYHESVSDFCLRNGLSIDKPIIALLAGSRKQEIKDNLPAMIEACRPFVDRYQLVLAGAPAISEAYYSQVMRRCATDILVRRVDNETYALLSHAVAALVTSGTATLETALFDVPQVVCYKTPVPHLIRFAFNHVIQCRYISLVNLIADREIVPELFADRFSVAQIRRDLTAILPNGTARESILADYREVHRRLGDDIAPDNAAALMTRLLDNVK